MKSLYSIIVIESIAIIVLCYFLFRQPAPIAPVIYFDKIYQRHMDSADNVLRGKDSVIASLSKKRIIRDSIRFIDYKKDNEKHSQVNNFNGITRGIWWDSTFRTNSVH